MYGNGQGDRAVCIHKILVSFNYSSPALGVIDWVGKTETKQKWFAVGE